MIKELLFVGGFLDGQFIKVGQLHKYDYRKGDEVQSYSLVVIQSGFEIREVMLWDEISREQMLDLFINSYSHDIQ